MSTPTNRFEPLLDHAEKNPKVNFTHYQLAIAELDESTGVDTAAAYRRLRNVMENKFSIESLDAVIDTIKK